MRNRINSINSRERQKAGRGDNLVLHIHRNTGFQENDLNGRLLPLKNSSDSCCELRLSADLSRCCLSSVVWPCYTSNVGHLYSILHSSNLHSTALFSLTLTLTNGQRRGKKLVAPKPTCTSSTGKTTIGILRSALLLFRSIRR